MVVWTLFYTIFDVNGIKKCVPLTFNAAGLATRTIHREMYNFRDQLKMTFRNQFMLPRTPSKGGKMVPRYPFLSPGWFMLPDSTTCSLRHNFDEIMKINEKGLFQTVRCTFKTQSVSNTDSKIIMECLKKGMHTNNTVDLTQAGIDLA